MAYTAWAFTISQVLGSPENIVVTSVTSGTDAAVTQRRVYISDDAGNFLVPDGITTEYNAWALATNPLTIEDIFETVYFIFKIEMSVFQKRLLLLFYVFHKFQISLSSLTLFLNYSMESLGLFFESYLSQQYILVCLSLIFKNSTVPVPRATAK